MTTPTYPRYPRTPVYVDAAPRKSLLLSAILTFFLGPLGMIYTTFLGTIVMTGLTLVVAVLTLGHGLPVVWPLCMIWGVWAGHRTNERHRRILAVRGDGW
ncbi:hypothetical protein [Mobilicoccus massiliensis]|uniref:hypothetical protein n=1 Tax=Mobilicoccus massiliensis TaxID=1522310 RepID=UPI0006933C8E|nr:hypothetical protein [Mobilicoccus massiliensis]